MENEPLEVIFRIWEGDEIALFPYFIFNANGNIMSYQFTGEHGEADYDRIMNHSRPISEPQSCDLYKELVSIGYNIKIAQRRRYSRYLEAFKAV